MNWPVVIALCLGFLAIAWLVLRASRRKPFLVEPCDECGKPIGREDRHVYVWTPQPLYDEPAGVESGMAAAIHGRCCNGRCKDAATLHPARSA